jgi:hypothetical protein
MNHHTYKMLDALMNLGIKGDDARALRRISMTLNRWSELANGEHRRAGVIADREKGAQKRLAAIMARYPELWAYQQGDPRGCALYVGKQADLNGRDVDSLYSTLGVAIC